MVAILEYALNNDPIHTCSLRDFMNKPITLPLARFLELALGNLENIELPIDEAILIDTLDKTKDPATCYVEFRSKLNDLETPLLWNLKAWKTNEKSREKARKLAAERRIEYDNYKTNLYLINDRLKSITGTSDCLEMSSIILRTLSDDCLIYLDVKLTHPYYRGEYIIL